jgi:hypothetical protein
MEVRDINTGRMVKINKRLMVGIAMNTPNGVSIQAWLSRKNPDKEGREVSFKISLEDFALIPRKRLAWHTGF